VFTRADEREAGVAYQRRLRARGPGPTLTRFAMSSAGAFLVNTPLFLLQRQLEISPRQRVLDIGCGRGAALRFLAGRVAFEHPPVGIDIAPAALDLAHADTAAGPALDLVAAAATRLPFVRESFDLILATYLVKHLGDRAIDRFLYECWRVLRPNGALLIWDYAPTRSQALNRLHDWLLTRWTPAVHLRGFRNLVDVVVESSFASMELMPLRPFLLPPIPRVAVLIRKGEAVARTGPNAL
jgi:cyclopropane fatty-acyl-phospholipid synthase-like methyltransferase